MPYSKLDTGLIHSTVWREPHTTRIVWITMLAMANKDGEVMASVPGLADVARVTQRECETALSAFLSADPDSRTKLFEGRRIQTIPGGWFLINYDEHRKRGDKEDQKEKNRRRQQRFRERQKALSGPISDHLPPENGHNPVTKNVISNAACAAVTENNDKAEAKADTKAKTTQVLKKHSSDFGTAWAAYPKRGGGNSRKAALKAWTARLRDGVQPDDLLAGVQRYAAYVRATGAEGTQYVKLAATFFGPDEHWRDDWTPPPPTNGRKPHLTASRDALRKWAEGSAHGE